MSRASRRSASRRSPASRPYMECHIQDDAGHAFDNHEAPMFLQPASAARAGELTKAFLARTLPV